MRVQPKVRCDRTTPGRLAACLPGNCNATPLILLNSDDQVFLINAIDPNDPSKPPWWEIPGGGIDPGEASAACAARELWEEGGFDEVQVGPVVFTQHVEFSFGGIDFDQDEVIHVAKTDQTDIRKPQGLEYLEALAFQGARWLVVIRRG